MGKGISTRFNWMEVSTLTGPLTAREHNILVSYQDSDHTYYNADGVIAFDLSLQAVTGQWTFTLTLHRHLG